MSPLHSSQYGLDPFRVGPAPSPVAFVQRRLGGRWTVDPFGFDPQLTDFVAPLVRAVVHAEVEGADRIPATGPAVLVANRGLGLAEPAALGVAVERTTGRRLRAVGAPDLPVVSTFWRRFGVVGGHPADLAGLLRGGHLVTVPLGPSWLRTGAGPPPLDLCQAMLGSTVFPVAVSPVGRLGGVVGRWRVRIGAHVALDSTYPKGDPLGAAELGEAVRDAVRALLEGGDGETASPVRADLAETGSR